MKKNCPAHSEQSCMTSVDYTAVEHYRCCDRGKHRAMGLRGGDTHIDVGEGTQREEVKIPSWVCKNNQVTGRYRRVTKVSLSHWDDSVSSLILERIVRLWKGCWHWSGWWPSWVWTLWHILSFRIQGSMALSHTLECLFQFLILFRSVSGHSWLARDCT